MGVEALSPHPFDSALAAAAFTTSYAPPACAGGIDFYECASGAYIAFDGRLCACCGAVEGVRPEPSRTQYPWDGLGADPNADVALCRECAVDHHRHWGEQWSAYYHDRL